MSTAGGHSVQIRLLGGFELRSGDRMVIDQAWPRRKEQALVKLLALQPGLSIDRDRVLAALWPELPAAAAATNLRKVRHTLAAALRDRGVEHELVVLSGGTLSLAPNVLVDVHAFRDASGEARSTRTSADLYERALSLCAGDLLPDDRFEEWTQAARSDLRDLQRTLALELAALYEAQAEPARALACAERVIAQDPTDEEAHRFIMNLYASTGRRERALQQFEICRAALERELGTEPNAETRALAERIKGGQARRQRSSSATPGRFVGRADETATLRSALDHAVAGRGGVVLLAGEAGIGKTRLVEELAVYAQVSGARVVWGRCYEDEGLPGFWPWVQVIRACAPRSRSTSDSIASLLDEQPVPAAGRSGPGGERSRVQLFGAVVDFLRASASAQPLVLAFDDLHWGDSDSLQLIRFAARELRDAPILFLGTYRDDEVAGHPLAEIAADLNRLSSTQVLSVHGLTRDAVAQLVQREAGDDVTDSFIDELTARTQGNPLYVTEALRMVTAGGGRPHAGDAWTVGLAGPARDVMRRLLDRLSPECQRLLEVAAVIGHEFDLVQLERVAELPRINLLAILDEAAGESVVTEPAHTVGRFAFRHPLMREVFYDQIALDQRVQLHRRVGEALEFLYQTELDAHLPELAHHFYRAATDGADIAKAVGYMQRAGERAAASLAYEEAVRLYTAAIQLVETSLPVDRARRADLRIALAPHLRRISTKDDALSQLEDAIEDARAANDATRFARAVVEYTRANHGAMPDYDSIRLVDEALTWLGDGAPRVRARVLGQLANLLALTPEEERRARVSEEAVSLARSTGDRELLAHALVNWHDANSGPDNLEDRAQRLSEAVKLAQAAADGALQCNARQRLIAAHIEFGDIASFERELAVLESVATKYRIRNYQKWVAILRALRLLLLGAFDAAEEQAREGLALGQEVGDPDAVSVYGAQLFQLRWDQGRLAEIEPILRSAAQDASALPAWKAAIAVLRVELGDLAQARGQFNAVASDLHAIPRDRFWTVTMLLLSHVCALLGDRDHAGQLYDLLLPYAGRTGVLSYGQVCGGSNERTLGLLAACLERFDDAQGHFERALAANERMGALPFYARTQLGYARMLLQRGASGDIGKACALLGEALSTAQELGMAGVVQEATAVAASVPPHA